MKWFFEPRRNGGENGSGGDGHSASGPGGSGPGEDDSAPGLLGLPPAVLLRHGALVLDPGQAAAIAGWPTPRSTVYRARTLLVPDDLLQDPAFIRAVNAVLARVGMALVAPASRRRGAPGNGESPGTGPEADVRRQLPRPAVLVPAVPADGTAALPVVIDAWMALQALRPASSAQVDSTARAAPVLDEQAVRRIALEHLLVGSALTVTGSPASDGGGLTGSPASDGGGLTGPSSTDSYVYSGDTRTPVAVCFEKPGRKSREACDAVFGRRPVIAVLDTGVRRHTWLDIEADPAGGYKTFPDGFVAVDHDMQHAIREEGQQAAAAGDQPRQVIKHPWDTPVTSNALVGELDSDTGHCTFIAGIVRQVAPDAQVLAVRIMHSDGVVNEGDLICALGLLADRVAAAEDGDLAGMVDVVCLSLGYFDESAADVAYSSGVWQAIEVLLEMGVVIVAAAGNYSTSQKFYPAAFTEQLSAADPVPLISVGALNPDHSKALFSDDASWVTAWAPGAAVVSTFPMDINASRSPEIRLHAHPASEMPAGGPLPGEREALDPDDYTGGFALWSGTSFSAPVVAAHLARSLLEGAAGDEALKLNVSGVPATAIRAMAALKNLDWPG